jgi:hypothetical protein
MIPFWKLSSSLLLELLILKLLSLSLSELSTRVLFFEFGGALPPNQLGDFGKVPFRAGSSSEVRVCTVAESLYMSGRSLSALEPSAAFAGNGADMP